MPDNPTPPHDADLDGSFELAAMLDALVAPPTLAELAEESAAVAAFTQVAFADVSSTPTPTSGRARMLTTITASKLALAAAAAGIAVAGGVAAAYAGALPTTLQDAAHQTIGAPAADSSTTASDTESSTEPADPTESDSPDQTDSTAAATSTPVGPDANGPAAFGLCTAYTHGGLATTSVAYQALVKAAGGAGNIAAHCATIAHPGNRPTGHTTGKPTSRPTGSPTTHPTGKPSSHPTGSPTTHRH